MSDPVAYARALLDTGEHRVPSFARKAIEGLLAEVDSLKDQLAVERGGTDRALAMLEAERLDIERLRDLLGDALPFVRFAATQATIPSNIESGLDLAERIAIATEPR